MKEAPRGSTFRKEQVCQMNLWLILPCYFVPLIESAVLKYMVNVYIGSCQITSA